MNAALATTALPDVPRLSMSAVEQTWRFMRDPIPLVERGRAECGDLFTVRVLGLGSWVFVCSPDGVEEMVHTSAEDLVAGEMFQRIFAELCEKGSLITLDGRPHIERRRIMQPYFRDEQVRLYIGALQRISSRVVDAWPTDRPVVLLDELHEISFQSVLETIFGLDATDTTLALPKLLRRAVEENYTSPLLWAPPLQVDLGAWSPWGRILRLHAEVCAALEAFIAERRASPDLHERQDVLSRLIVYQTEHPDQVTDASLREEMIQLTVAGFDTSGFIGTWVIECLLSYPFALEQARAQVDEVVGDGPVGREHLPRLTYLEALMHESIRHRMPSPFAGVRLAKRDLTLLGHRIPAGSLVSMCLAGLGMREETFPEPHLFRPERFLDEKPPIYAWNPFGSGTHQCIGKHLALAELKITLATILARTDLSLIDVDRGRQRSGTFFVPRHGLRVRVARRAPAA